MDLFSFDFTDEKNELMTEEKVKEKFTELQKLFKEKGNGYCYRYEYLPRNTMIYIDEFVKRGWVEHKFDSGINIPDEHLDYHKVEELVNEFRNAITKAIDQKDVCWYKNVLPIINFVASPIRYASEEDKEQVHFKKKEIERWAALQLGKNHFINVPEARGMKMDLFARNKWANKNVLPLITEMIIPITDYDKMAKLFSSNAFYIGRSDDHKNMLNIAPYPEYIRMSPSSLEIASLCQTEDVLEIKLILEYLGYAMGRTPKEKCIYPSGWSFDKYLASLTNEDKQKLREDRERLIRLHDRDIMSDSPVFRNILRIS